WPWRGSGAPVAEDRRAEKSRFGLPGAAAVWCNRGIDRPATPGQRVHGNRRNHSAVHSRRSPEDAGRGPLRTRRWQPRGVRQELLVKLRRRGAVRAPPAALPGTETRLGGAGGDELSVLRRRAEPGAPGRRLLPP